MYFTSLHTKALLYFAYGKPCIAYMTCLPVLRTKVLLCSAYNKPCIAYMTCLSVFRFASHKGFAMLCLW